MTSSLRRALLPILIVTFAAAPGTRAQTAVVWHAPNVSGRIEGSIQQLAPESVALSGNATITGDLIVPGTPTISVKSAANYGGTVEGAGDVGPTNFQITVTGNATLRHVITRSNPVAIATVAAPAQPTGARSVTVNAAKPTAGDFSTISDLTVSGVASPVIIPGGAYGRFTINGGSVIVLGIPGETLPITYSFQEFKLNGNAELRVVSPVVVTLGVGLTTSGLVGSRDEPKWLDLRIADGGVSLNGGAALHGKVTAPNGMVSIVGNSRLVGTTISDRLSISGGGVLHVLEFEPPLPPVSFDLPYTTDFEAAEGYRVGPLDGQRGWTIAATNSTAEARANVGNLRLAELLEAAVRLRTCSLRSATRQRKVPPLHPLFRRQPESPRTHSRQQGASRTA